MESAQFEVMLHKKTKLSANVKAIANDFSLYKYLKTKIISMLIILDHF
jgi:hypothetical protein